MQHIVSIRNFLVIKKADLHINKINVIIGPQAKGKSLIAKLTYFLKSVSREIIEGIRLQEGKRDLDKRILQDFEKRFPRYTWDGSSFSILYQMNDVTVSIIGKAKASGKTSLSIEYSQNLSTLFKKYKKIYVRILNENTEEKEQVLLVEKEFFNFHKHIVMPLKNSEFEDFFRKPVFIPASRSFFANLQKNIFTFLASNLDIDPFLKEFGSIYENSKRLYRDHYFGNEVKLMQDSLHKSFETIIDGDYEYYEEQDWIVKKGKKINLINASSGQQESLPMLLALSVVPFLRFDGKKGSMFFIEEPEAHLFPTSQAHIVSIFSLLFQKIETTFFITTHSPYILSAFNNFILADDVIKEGRMTVEEFVELNGSGLPISFDDVSAYTLQSGTLVSIKDEESRMIGGDILDYVSDHFQNVANKLLECGG